MLIGISGKKRAGKDLFASLLTAALYDKADPSRTLNVESKKYADPLKRMAEIFLGDGFMEKWESEGTKWREESLPFFWNKQGQPMTRRQFLQELGTEAVRENLHQDAWVNACFSNFDIDKHNWIFTDMRFENELRAIEERQGIVIRIERPGIDTSDQHPSETALDDYDDWDFIIENATEIPFLRKAAQEVVAVIDNLNYVKSDR